MQIEGSQEASRRGEPDLKREFSRGALRASPHKCPPGRLTGSGRYRKGTGKRGSKLARTRGDAAAVVQMQTSPFRLFDPFAAFFFRPSFRGTGASEMGGDAREGTRPQTLASQPGQADKAG